MSRPRMNPCACPQCGETSVRIIETRKLVDGGRMRRLVCVRGHRFTVHLDGAPPRNIGMHRCELPRLPNRTEWRPRPTAWEMT